MQNTQSQARPLGVTIIAILLLLAAIVEILIGVLTFAGVFTVAHFITVHGHHVAASVLDTLGGILAGISILIGIVTLVFAWGLWTLKTWAFWLVVALEVFSLLRHLFEFTRPDHSTIAIVLGLVLPVVILLYFLIDPNVRAAFFRT
jgi:uncharacterized membrane protein (DUF2068 family)